MRCDGATGGGGRGSRSLVTGELSGATRWLGRLRKEQVACAHAAWAQKQGSGSDERAALGQQRVQRAMAGTGASQLCCGRRRR